MFLTRQLDEQHEAARRVRQVHDLLATAQLCSIDARAVEKDMSRVSELPMQNNKQGCEASPALLLVVRRENALALHSHDGLEALLYVSDVHLQNGQTTWSGMKDASPSHWLWKRCLN
jgi:hypothetical protein